MKPVEIKKAGNFFDKNNRDLHFLLTKVKHLSRLEERFKTYLPPEIASRTCVANVIGEQLVILANSGAVASHFRMVKQELIQQFKRDPLLGNIKDIHCKVNPHVSDPGLSEKKPKVANRFSRETSLMIAELAEGLTDPKLKEIMLNIAKHGLEVKT